MRIHGKPRITGLGWGWLFRERDQVSPRSGNASSAASTTAAVDCHTHLLPGLDDGVGSWDEAVRLARSAWSDGTRCLILTPHYLPGIYEPQPEAIKAAAAELAARIRSDDAQLEIFAGCEAYLCPELPDLLKEGKLLLMGEPVDHRGTTCASGAVPYLLVEMPHGEIPSWADEVLFRLKIAGVTPVLAHPERCAGVRHNYTWIKEVVKRGALVQVNTLSLTGAYGREIQRRALLMLKSGIIHLIGSDAHSFSRPPLLSDALGVMKRHVGERVTTEIAWYNPLNVLGGVYTAFPSESVLNKA